jgi:hypothetical protein
MEVETHIPSEVFGSLKKVASDSAASAEAEAAADD